MNYSIELKRLENSIEKKDIQEKYQDNLIFQWLELPCLRYCNKKGLLSREELFYLCFLFLDSIKQIDNYSDCISRHEMSCLPYKIKLLFDEDEYSGDSTQCSNDRLLLLTTLYTLLQLTYDQLLMAAAKGLTDNLFDIIPSQPSTFNEMIYFLTDGSPFYEQYSNDIFQYEDQRLINFIQKYMASKQRISNEIERLSTIQPKDNYSMQPNNQQLLQLQEELKKKDEEIEALKKQLNTHTLSDTNYVEIDSTCKSKIVAILAAMFNAHFFHGVGKTDRDSVLGYILQHGFNYSTKSIAQLLSQYLTNGGDLNDLKIILREALNDLHQIQKK